MGLFSFLKKSDKVSFPMPILSDLPTIPRALADFSSYNYRYNDGSKFFNGFGETKLFIEDYFTLRARSAQLFKENIYARGLIRRLVTNEINTGLTPEVIPNASLLGLDDDELGAWSENVEDRFTIWADSPDLCDTTRKYDFGKIQRIIRAESIITGDVLLILRMDRTTGLPRIQIISGTNVETPIGQNQSQALTGNRIEYGVELNKFNQHVAFHVLDSNGKYNRIPSTGAKSKRRIAWLVYGCDKRMGEVRGEPLLSIVLQSIKEIDRYRDATQRKAAINAMLAMFIQKDQDKVGTKPITGGAVRKKSAEFVEQDGSVRKYNIVNQIPGLVIEDLQVGEKPVAFGNEGTDTNFADFEASIINAIAWANEIPPEILQLSFSSNYSASQAAINEFKNYLNRIRSEFGAMVCRPIYQEWLLSEVLSQKIKATGLLEAWRDPLQYDTYGAWVASDWSGAIKPSTDIKKQAQGYTLMVESGWITNARAARELTGTKFSRNIDIIGRENKLKLDAGLVVNPSNPSSAEDNAETIDVSDENNSDSESDGSEEV